MTNPVLTRARREDLAVVLALLEQSGLPAEGVAEHFEAFWVARAGGRRTGGMRRAGAIR